jgi:hypothetical protein
MRALVDHGCDFGSTEIILISLREFFIPRAQNCVAAQRGGTSSS